MWFPDSPGGEPGLWCSCLPLSPLRLLGVGYLVLTSLLSPRSQIWGSKLGSMRCSDSIGSHITEHVLLPPQSPGEPRYLMCESTDRQYRQHRGTCSKRSLKTSFLDLLNQNQTLEQFMCTSESDNTPVAVFTLFFITSSLKSTPPPV